MAKKKKKSKATRKPLEREDVHAHPEQGDKPYPRPFHHRHPGTGHPFRVASFLMDTHVGGGSGFVTGNAGMPGPYFGLGPRNYARSDQRVLEDVCDLLTLHGELDVQHVDVHIRDGVIRLEGNVPTRWMWREIEAVSESVPGVERVQNDLAVASTN